MRSLVHVTASLMCLLGGAAVADDGREALPRLDPGQVLRGMVRESDVTLFFDFLRGSLAAAIEGREAPVPEELKQRAEALGETLRTQGLLAALAVLAALEQRAKEGLRKAPPPRATVPPAWPVAAPND